MMKLKNFLLAVSFLLIFSTPSIPQPCDTTEDGYCSLSAEKIKFNGISDTVAQSLVGDAVMYFDPITGKLQCSEDGGAFVDCVGGVGGGGGSNPALKLNGVTNVTSAAIINFVGPEFTLDESPANTGVLGFGANVFTAGRMAFIGSSTGNAGYIFVADGTDFESVAMSGDVTIGADGVTTIQANAIGSSEITDASIDETDLDTSVNASLDLADSALQSNQTITLSGSVTGSGATSITTFIATNAVTASNIDFIGTPNEGNAGYIFISDGTDYQGVALSGDITVGAYGVTTIQPDAVGSAEIVNNSVTAGDLAETYLTGNETITISGDASGSGTTAISLSLATNSVADNEIDYSQVTLGDFTNDAFFTPNAYTGVAGSSNEIAMFDASGNIDGSGLVKGTFTDGRYCKYTSSGTLIDCNSTCADITGSADLCDGVDNTAAGGAGDDIQINAANVTTAIFTDNDFFQFARDTNTNTVQIYGVANSITAGMLVDTYLTAEVDGSTTNELQNLFNTVTVAGETPIVASSNTDTLELVPGLNMTITIANGTVVFSSTDTDTDTQLSEEEVEDFVGGMLGGTETLISVDYDDLNNSITFVVDNDLSNYDNSTSAFLNTSTGISSLADVGATAYALGALLVADGNSYEEVVMSGDVTIDSAGVSIVANDSHNHTSSSISGLDISADTNLAFTAPIVLTDDTLSLNQNAGTDVTADLEEETHASEHESGGNDTINHDSLTGFVANEHIDWTQSGAGTIHATNYVDDDTPESGDFGNALALESTGAISTNAVTASNIDFIGTPTATSGFLMVADGSNYQGVAMSGDGTINASGAIKLNPTQLAVGANNAVTIEVNDIGTLPFAQVIETDNALEGGLAVVNSDETIGFPGFIVAARARGTPTSKAAVQTDDALATYAAGGYDGDEFVTGGQIQFIADDNASDDYLPTRIQFVLRDSSGEFNSLRIGSDKSITLQDSGIPFIYGTQTPEAISSIGISPNNATSVGQARIELTVANHVTLINGIHAFIYNGATDNAISSDASVDRIIDASERLTRINGFVNSDFAYQIVDDTNGIQIIGGTEGAEYLVKDDTQSILQWVGRYFVPLFSARNSGQLNVQDYYGIGNSPYLNSTTAGKVLIDRYHAFYDLPRMTAGEEATTYKSFELDTAQIASGAIINDLYGLYLGDDANNVATNYYSVWSADSDADMYHKGLIFAGTSDTQITDVAGTLKGENITNNSITTGAFLATNSPTDNYVPTFDLATGGITWDTNGAGGGDSVTIDGASITDPDFRSDGQISFVDNSNTVVGYINSNAITSSNMYDTSLFTRELNYVFVDQATNVTSTLGIANSFLAGNSLTGYDVVWGKAYVDTAGVTGTTTINLYNERGGCYMFTGGFEITSGNTKSSAGTVNTSCDDINEGDFIRPDVLGVSTTAPTGAGVVINVRKP